MKSDPNVQSNRSVTPNRSTSSRPQRSLPEASRKNSGDADMMERKGERSPKSTSPRKGKLKEPTAEEKEATAPSHFKCPISLELMTDPVFCSDGYTYERSQIEKWMDQPNARSPFTRLPLTVLGANVGLRSAIWEQFPELQKHFVRPALTYSGEKNIDGLPHGQGHRIFPNGTVEDGHFQNGELAQGSRQLGSGNKEIGTFVDGKLNGPGERYYAIGHKAGQTRTGEFRHGVMVHGTIRFSNDLTYTGELKDEKFHGQGTWINGGLRYEGTFVDGRPHGKGIKIFVEGLKYAGDFQHGVFHGEGTLESPDGSRYTGSFVDGKPHGKGELIFLDGNSYRGTFQRGSREGYGIHQFPSGSKYVGNHESDTQHGIGVLYFSDGRIYEGNFVRNRIEGHGVMTSKAGISLEGEFFDGKPTGTIRMKKGNQEVIVHPHSIDRIPQV